MEDEGVKQIISLLSTPFYKNFQFITGTVIGVASLVFSVKAYKEAKQAKKAAFAAGKTVKIQTITIELTEIAQRLDKLDSEMQFTDARNLLNEISRRLRRLIAPFQDNGDLSEKCETLKKALDDAKQALDEVMPKGGEDSDISGYNVYFATQGHFSNISSIVAEIMGLFEKRSIEEQ